MLVKSVERKSQYNTQLSDVSALQGLTQLTSLSLHYNQLSDVSALQGLTQLTFLRLSGNPLKGCSPKNLEELKSGKSCN